MNLILNKSENSKMKEDTKIKNKRDTNIIDSLLLF